MTPTEQRVALAEWMGWSCIETAEGSFVYGYPPEGTIVGNTIELPDFLNDLNAVHVAEKKLNPAEGARFYWMLAQVVNPLQMADKIEFDLVHATAPQRCEALLRCLNLWKET